MKFAPKDIAADTVGCVHSHLGVTIDQMFEPCDNLKAGARILSENYAGASKRYVEGQKALRAAISTCNTGNYKSGFANGYVARVDASAGVETPGQIPPLVPAPAAKHQAKAVIADAPIRVVSTQRTVHVVHASRSREPRVFVYGHGDENQRSYSAAASPKVSWVKR